MIYQVNGIIEDVRVCMDENVVSEGLLAGSDVETLTLNELIRSKIIEAVERVHTDAPYYKLDTGVNIEDADSAGIHWRGSDDTCGWLLLPTDFMRLVVFEMSDWERPVYSVITPDSVEYQKQMSRHKGIRGTAERPVVALGVRPEGRVLEFWSCKSRSATVTRGVYIPYPTITGDQATERELINVSRLCYEAMKYMAAGLVLSTQGETERAKQMIETANTYLQR